MSKYLNPCTVITHPTHQVKLPCIHVIRHFQNTYHSRSWTECETVGLILLLGSEVGTSYVSSSGNEDLMGYLLLEPEGTQGPNPPYCELKCWHNRRGAGCLVKITQQVTGRNKIRIHVLCPLYQVALILFWFFHSLLYSYGLGFDPWKLLAGSVGEWGGWPHMAPLWHPSSINPSPGNKRVSH